jgi:hypothetical protein
MSAANPEKAPGRASARTGSADDAKRQGGFRHEVYLPVDADKEHLHADFGYEKSCPREGVVAIFENDKWRFGLTHCVI